jgi:hypothetical protein
MNEYYVTQSLNVAAYLVCSGYKVKKTEKNSVGMTTFFFERSDEVYKAIDEYNNDEKLRKFIAAFREIKQMAH